MGALATRCDIIALVIKVLWMILTTSKVSRIALLFSHFDYVTFQTFYSGINYQCQSMTICLGLSGTALVYTCYPGIINNSAHFSFSTVSWFG